MPPTSASSSAEDEEIVGLVGAPILGVARQPGAKAGAAQRVGRPSRLPRRQKMPRARRAGWPIPRNRRARARAERPARRPAGTAPARARKSRGKALRCGAIAAAAFRRRAGPAAARNPRAGRPARAPPGSAAPSASARRRGAIAASSTASMRRTISGGSNGVPWISICCAICSQRAEVLSSDISSPAFICALARASSTARQPVAEPHRLVAQRRHEFRRLVLAGAGIDAEQAAVAIAVGKGMDRVDEAALLAHLLEEARRHAAAERRRQHRGGVIVGVVEHEPGEPEHQVQLLEVALLALVAADIARRLGRDRPLGRAARRAACRRDRRSGRGRDCRPPPAPSARAP